MNRRAAVPPAELAEPADSAGAERKPGVAPAVRPTGGRGRSVGSSSGRGAGEPARQ